MDTQVQIQQGDIILIPISEIPDSALLQEGDLIQEGEATGHAHRLTEGQIYVEPDSKVKYLRLVVPSEVTHNTHHPIQVPPNLYEVRVVLEKGMFSDLVAPVVD